MLRNFTLNAVLAVLLLGFTHCALASTTSNTYHIYFQTDSFSLTPEGQQQVTDLVDKLPTTGETEVWVAGYTDAEGNAAYNIRLSQQRMVAVVKALQFAGIAATEIHEDYYGETRPVMANNNEMGKAKNRRVEITIKHVEVTSLAELIDNDATLNSQQFSIDATIAQTITGLKGMQLEIPANAFVNMNGNVVKAESVKVELTEYSTVADAFFHGVTSMSDKGLLESGGMFYVKASANGVPVQLAPGKEIGVKLPVAKPQDGMKVYFSKTDSNGMLIWTETCTAFKPVTQPADTQKIKLAPNKYESFLTANVTLPLADGLPAIERFAYKEPAKPTKPRLTLQKEKDIKNSGLRYITKSKRMQQKMLDKMNTQIKNNNAKRVAKYNEQLAIYLADSAAYPVKLDNYSKAKLAFMEYCFDITQNLDSLKHEYFRAIVKRRMQYYIKTVLTASENGLLYNSNLSRNLKNFCISSNSTLRNFSYERKLGEAYMLASLKGLTKKECYAGIPFFEGHTAFAKLMADSATQAMVSGLIDDNPYLTAEERKLQKMVLAGSYIASTNENYQQLSYYQATVGQLGYVNCDRLRTSQNVVAMDFYNIQQGAESVAFIKGINASQGISETNNKFKKDEDLRLLSVYFENGRPQVAFKEVKASANQKVDLQYKEMKVAEFKELVMSLI